ncbi:hypothetical protein D3C76_455170 [compost metagenome]
MVNALSKITAALLAVILLFLYPAMQTAQRQEDMNTLYAYNALVQFTDAIRNKGYLSPVMYEEFARQIETTGVMYDIQLEHQRKKYHPEYEDPANEATFKGDFTVVYDSYYSSEILKVLYPDHLFTGSNPASDPSSRRYKFEFGDFVNIALIKRSKTPYAILSSFLLGDVAKDSQEKLSYGGMVLNEDY